MASCILGLTPYIINKLYLNRQSFFPAFMVSENKNEIDIICRKIFNRKQYLSKKYSIGKKKIVYQKHTREKEPKHHQQH